MKAIAWIELEIGKLRGLKIEEERKMCPLCRDEENKLNVLCGVRKCEDGEKSLNCKWLKINEKIVC
jgi:hypothetical protein